MMVSKFQEFFVKEEKGTRRRRRITGEFLTLRFDVTTLTCVFPDSEDSGVFSFFKLRSVLRECNIFYIINVSLCNQ